VFLKLVKLWERQQKAPQLVAKATLEAGHPRHEQPDRPTRAR